MNRKVKRKILKRLRRSQRSGRNQRKPRKLIKVKAPKKQHLLT
ncbi:hypothetical protein T01_3041 [Trichinella spiralis]|uniref:Uncharacterized protein n=1 Tax=Trichinella spiralis TaxID=6334 RepID=A0A0V0YTP3_TRISP|nr:hypothetical protein T01_3041 [Trichinella spiralis]